MRGLLATIFFLLPVLVHAQPAESVAKRFTRTDAMIAMRDGVRLYTTVYVPKNRRASSQVPARSTISSTKVSM